MGRGDTGEDDHGLGAARGRGDRRRSRAEELGTPVHGVGQRDEEEEGRWEAALEREKRGTARAWEERGAALKRRGGGATWPKENQVLLGSRAPCVCCRVRKGKVGKTPADRRAPGGREEKKKRKKWGAPAGPIEGNGPDQKKEKARVKKKGKTSAVI